MRFIVAFLKYQYLTLHQKQKYLFSDKVLCRFHVLARIKHLVAVFETLRSRNQYKHYGKIQCISFKP